MNATISPPPETQPVGLTGAVLAVHQVLARIRQQVPNYDMTGVNLQCNALHALVTPGSDYGNAAARRAFLQVAAEILHDVTWLEELGHHIVRGTWAEVPIWFLTPASDGEVSW